MTPPHTYIDVYIYIGMYTRDCIYMVIPFLSRHSCPSLSNLCGTCYHVSKVSIISLSSFLVSVKLKLKMVPVLRLSMASEPPSWRPLTFSNNNFSVPL